MDLYGKKGATHYVVGLGEGLITNRALSEAVGGSFRSAAADLRFWVGRNGDSWPANHAKGRERGKGFLNDLSGWQYLRGLGNSLRIASGDMPKLRSWSWIIRHFEVVWLQDGSHRDTRSLLCGGLCRSVLVTRWAGGGFRLEEMAEWLARESRERPRKGERIPK